MWVQRSPRFCFHKRVANPTALPVPYLLDPMDGHKIVAFQTLVVTDLNNSRVGESSICVAVADSSTPDFLTVAQDYFIARSIPADGASGDVINEVVVSSTTSSDVLIPSTSGQQIVPDANHAPIGQPNSYNTYRIHVDISFMQASESSDVDGNSDPDFEFVSDSEFESESESDFEYGSDIYEADDLEVDIEGDGSLVGSDELSQDYNVSNGSSVSDQLYSDYSHSGWSYASEVSNRGDSHFSEDYNLSSSEHSLSSEISSMGEPSDAVDGDINDDVGLASNYGSSNEDDYISDELSMLSEDNAPISDGYAFPDSSNDVSGSGFDDSVNDSRYGFVNFRGGVEVQLFADGYWVVIPISR